MFKLCLFLLLGAIINIAVAWSLELLIKPGGFEIAFSEGLSESGSGYRGWQVFRRKCRHVTITASNWLGPHENWQFSGDRPKQSAESLIPCWAPELAPSSQPPSDATYFATAWECGWPARSLGGAAVMGRVDKLVHVNADWPVILTTEDMKIYSATMMEPALLKDANTHWKARPIVLRPLWPGFAINTIFYAAILWMLFAAPRALSRKRRLMRGLCPACAYPVATSDVCTECGKPVKV